MSTESNKASDIAANSGGKNGNQHVKKENGLNTHINQVRDIMDIIFTNCCIRGCQVQQIVISGFSALQLIFGVFGLPLKNNETIRIKESL